MNLLHEIKHKIEIFPKEHHLIGLDAVSIHIETAEKYYFRAKNDSEENLYTDVVYRTNQAFEGILKEAYTTLAGKKSEKINPYEIETYLERNNIFNQRVLNLFSTYRKEWRNVSTHNYKLFFSEQEAFLAIVNVSSFVTILLDQIIEKVNFNLEQKKIKEKVEQIKSSIQNYETLVFHEKIKQLLLSFYQNESEIVKVHISESEILGKLIGFIKTIEPKYNFDRELNIENEGRNIQPDLIISENKNRVLVEIKLLRKAFFNQQTFESQVFNYLYATDIQHGVLFVYNPEVAQISVRTQPDLGMFGKQFSVTTLSPKDKKSAQ